MTARLLKFGLFELNTGTRQFLKQGRPVRLQEQPLRILEMLLENPGNLVTRQELRDRLWPRDVYVDFDLGLTSAIRRLRLALGDSADNPRFIETVPKSGYRFIAPVQSVIAPGDRAEKGSPQTVGVGQLSGQAVQTAPEQSAAPLSPPMAKLRNRHVAVAVALALVVMAAYLLRPESPPLRVTRIAKLSDTGHAWAQESLFSDGARLYYTEFTAETSFQLRQILLNGNEDTVVAGLPPNALIRGLTPDSTTFQGISQDAASADVPSPVFVVPVIGGPLRRLGNLHTNDFTWSPDGKALAFGRDTQLFLARPDGTGERVLATLPGRVIYPRWSPDGHRLRFTVHDSHGQLAIWEVGVDGRNLHPLRFNFPGSPMEGFGEWTADGRYFVFASRREGISNLWAIEESADWLHRTRSEAVQLTAGPMSYYRPLPSRDGTRIFALGTQPAGELVRYDRGRKTFVPFLDGRSADHLDFTRDGRWVTYVAYPDGSLWRSSSDGSQPLQLTFSPLQVARPRWSPDGKRILFVGRRPGELPKIFTISFDGGSPEPVVSEAHAQTAPVWSPQGDSIIYSRDPDGENQDIALYRVDLQHGISEKIPGSEGLYAPLWSPDGRTLIAQSGDRLLVRVDPKTGKRTALSRRRADYPSWSADSQCLYFNSNTAGQSEVFLIHVSDGKEEKVTTIPFHTTGTYGTWTGLAPDGSVLALRDREQTDVYALSLALH